MKCLISIVGPTATGKTKLALRLAQSFNGEIINADSRQIYRFMDIGTAKPDKNDKDTIPHHLIDIIDPDEPFSLALYKKLAIEAIDAIQLNGRLPFLVGGSGLYIWSIIEGWVIPDVPPDMEFRRNLEQIAESKGAGTLFEELKTIDPIAADKIMPTNLRRIIRALEIYRSTGGPPSQLWQKKPLPYPSLIIGLTSARKALYNNIDSRVEEMIKRGFISEVKDLMASGYGLDLPSLSGIGYRQLGMFLQGKSTLSEAIQKIKYETHEFARRQNTWFRQNDARIHWFDAFDTRLDEIDNLVRTFLNNLGEKNDN